jgi:hypothetical protein
VTATGANIEINNTRPSEQANVDYTIKWHTVTTTDEVA